MTAIDLLRFLSKPAKCVSGTHAMFMLLTPSSQTQIAPAERPALPNNPRPTINCLITLDAARLIHQRYRPNHNHGPFETQAQHTVRQVLPLHRPWPTSLTSPWRRSTLTSAHCSWLRQHPRGRHFLWAYSLKRTPQGSFERQLVSRGRFRNSRHVQHCSAVNDG